MGNREVGGSADFRITSCYERFHATEARLEEARRWREIRAASADRSPERRPRWSLASWLHARMHRTPEVQRSRA